MKACISSCPREIEEKIYGYCDCQSKSMLSMVNRHWNELAYNRDCSGRKTYNISSDRRTPLLFFRNPPHNIVSFFQNEIREPNILGSGSYYISKHGVSSGTSSESAPLEIPDPLLAPVPQGFSEGEVSEMDHSPYSQCHQENFGKFEDKCSHEVEKRKNTDCSITSIRREDVRFSEDFYKYSSKFVIVDESDHLSYNQSKFTLKFFSTVGQTAKEYDHRIAREKDQRWYMEEGIRNLQLKMYVSHQHVLKSFKLNSSFYSIRKLADLLLHKANLEGLFSEIISEERFEELSAEAEQEERKEQEQYRSSGPAGLVRSPGPR